MKIAYVNSRTMKTTIRYVLNSIFLLILAQPLAVFADFDCSTSSMQRLLNAGPSTSEERTIYSYLVYGVDDVGYPYPSCVNRISGQVNQYMRTSGGTRIDAIAFTLSQGGLDQNAVYRPGAISGQENCPQNEGGTARLQQIMYFAGQQNTPNECPTSGAMSLGCLSSASLYCDGQPVAFRQFQFVKESIGGGQFRYRMYTAQHVLDEISRSRSSLSGCAFRLGNGLSVPTSGAIPSSSSEGDIAWFTFDNNQLNDTAMNSAIGRTNSSTASDQYCAYGRGGRYGLSSKYQCVTGAQAQFDSRSGGFSHCVPTREGFSGGAVVVVRGQTELARCIHIGWRHGELTGTEGESDPRLSPTVTTLPCSSENHNVCLGFPTR